MGKSINYSEEEKKKIERLFMAANFDVKLQVKILEEARDDAGMELIALYAQKMDVEALHGLALYSDANKCVTPDIHVKAGEEMVRITSENLEYQRLIEYTKECPGLAYATRLSAEGSISTAVRGIIKKERAKTFGSEGAVDNGAIRGSANKLLEISATNEVSLTDRTNAGFAGIEQHQKASNPQGSYHDMYVITGNPQYPPEVREKAAMVGIDALDCGESWKCDVAWNFQHFTDITNWNGCPQAVKDAAKPRMIHACKVALSKIVAAGAYKDVEWMANNAELPTELRKLAERSVITACKNANPPYCPLSVDEIDPDNPQNRRDALNTASELVRFSCDTRMDDAAREEAGKEAVGIYEKLDCLNDIRVLLKRDGLPEKVVSFAKETLLGNKLMVPPMPPAEKGTPKKVTA